jgi:NAD(P)-dependent dehydrogenase (short-subunit alcohol dehydrogenase family)
MRVLVVGGSGVIGRAVVAALAERHDVLTCGRTTCEYVVDMTSADSIVGLFEMVGPVDAVVCTAGDVVFKPLEAMSDHDFGLGLANKLMGQVNVVRFGQPFVRDGGSITLTSGVTGRRPIPGCTSVASVNGAVEGFVRAAALELPRGIRINAVSPQWTIESLTLFGMDPAWGVPAAQVALGYLEVVEGSMTGTVLDAGWIDDSLVASRPPAAVS